VIAAVLTTAGIAHAQPSAQELSQQAANPIADLVSLPIQNNTDFGLGPNDRARNVMNIQPVVPLRGGRIVTRTIIPIAWIPDLTADSGFRTTGLADILFTGFYVPESESLMWGIGPALEVPTGGSDRGTQKWSAGPAAVVLSQTGDWTLGLLTNNVWSFAGDSDRESVNKGILQYFIVRQLGQGWYVNSAPIISVNWKAESGDRWIVPFGLGVGKLSFLGRLPVNGQVGGFVNAIKPDIGPDWQLRVQLQVLFPVPGGS
jgi:hypothetical protein